MDNFKEGDRVIVKSKSVAIEEGFTYEDFIRNSPLAIGVIVEVHQPSLYFSKKEYFKIDYNTETFLVKPINKHYFAIFAKNDLILIEEEEKRGNK